MRDKLVDGGLEAHLPGLLHVYEQPGAAFWNPECHENRNTSRETHNHLNNNLVTALSVVDFRNIKFDLHYLLTRLANGCTCRDVPMTMRRSQRGKSWKLKTECALQRVYYCRDITSPPNTRAYLQTTTINSPSSLKWRTGRVDSLQRRQYLGKWSEGDRWWWLTLRYNSNTHIKQLCLLKKTENKWCDWPGLTRLLHLSHLGMSSEKIFSTRQKEEVKVPNNKEKKQKTTQ